MPDGNGIAQVVQEADTPQSGAYCIRHRCDLSTQHWVGVYWLYEDKWEPKEGCNLFEKLNAKKGSPIRCRFWARGKEDACIQFKVGGLSKGRISESLEVPATSTWLTLTNEWKMYEIDVTGKDLSKVAGAFVWVCDRGHNDNKKTVQFDLDTIYFTKVKNKTKDSE
jgi:hypothetical protein